MTPSFKAGVNRAEESIQGDVVTRCLDCCCRHADLHNLGYCECGA